MQEGVKTGFSIRLEVEAQGRGRVGLGGQRSRRDLDRRGESADKGFLSPLKLVVGAGHPPQ